MGPENQMEINHFTDDRGHFTNIPIDRYKRVYAIQNHQVGQVRAWHFHPKEEVWIVCLKGIWKVGKYKEGDEEPYFTTLEPGDALLVPPGHGNGNMNLTPDAVLLCCASLTLAEVREEEKKEPWDKFGEDVWQTKRR